MIAWLGMYDLRWLQAANDQLWAALAAYLRQSGVADVPDALRRDLAGEDAWRAPDLLLAQTCGYPLVTALRETVQVVATPRYRAQGCAGAWHRAAIVVRADDPATSLADLRGARAALNGPSSNTGANLLHAALAPFGDGFLGERVITGSHLRSLAHVLAGQADLASIDCVTFAHLAARYPRHAARLRVLAWTAATPGLPLVTAAGTSPATLAALRDALAAVAGDAALADTLATLRIVGFDLLDRDAYDAVLTPGGASPEPLPAWDAQVLSPAS